MVLNELFGQSNCQFKLSSWESDSKRGHFGYLGIDWKNGLEGHGLFKGRAKRRL